MTVQEYIEGAKRTETSTYEHYLRRVDEQPATVLTIMALLCGYGRAFDVYKKNFIYNKPVKLGDYTVEEKQHGEIIDDLFVYKIKDYSESLPEKMSAASVEVLKSRMSEPRIRRLVHGILGVVTEQAELMEEVVKYVVNQDPTADLDYAKCRLEGGDSCWYGAIELDVLGQPLEQMAQDNQDNQDKLRIRFPDAFVEELAINKDADKEQEKLGL